MLQQCCNKVLTPFITESNSNFPFLGEHPPVPRSHYTFSCYDADYLDTECKQSQQGSPSLLGVVCLCTGAWEWCTGHGVHGKVRGQPSRVSLWHPLFEPGFSFCCVCQATWATSLQRFFYVASHLSMRVLRLQMLRGQDTHQAISSASFPLQVLWLAFHCMDILHFFPSKQTFKLFSHPSYWGWCCVSLW